MTKSKYELAVELADDFDQKKREFRMINIGRVVDHWHKVFLKEVMAAAKKGKRRTNIDCSCIGYSLYYFFFPLFDSEIRDEICRKLKEDGFAAGYTSDLFIINWEKREEKQCAKE
jgi:hypothetical protein